MHMAAAALTACCDAQPYAVWPHTVQARPCDQVGGVWCVGAFAGRALMVVALEPRTQRTGTCA